MIFRFLLFGFSMMMRGAFWMTRIKDKRFREHLASGDFVMQVTTGKTSRGRYFMLGDGRFSSKYGIPPREADLLIQWSDAYTPLFTLFKFRPETLVKSISRAIAEGKLAVEMELAKTTWFGLAMLRMVNSYVDLNILKEGAK